MSAIAQTWQRVWRRGDAARAATVPAEPAAPATVGGPSIEIAENDPLLAFLQSAGGAVEVDRLELESPAVTALREAGVALVVPLVSGGELIGTLNLGPRLSDQQYSTDDKKLLDALAAQAAPALQVAELVRRQAAEAASRERIEQELKVAQLIQQNFLPRELPDLPGWHVEAYYKPAREVGGDFYDFLPLPDGRVAVVIGDVTDKGVPAAMVMAAARSILRASGAEGQAPGDVLARVNDLLCPDIPERMFVTCLYAVLDPSSGRIVFANAGHNLPFARRGAGAVELRATGMPLGLLPGMDYDEVEFTLAAGEALVLYSDGVTEAHDPTREMFGNERFAERLAATGQGLIDGVLTGLREFTGTAWEQEDDITMVALRRTGGTATGVAAPLDVRFEIPSEPGNERQAMDRVTEAVAPLALAPEVLERLRTAVSETAMNAIEHGNQGQAELPIEIAVTTGDGHLVVRVADQGRGGPARPAEVPDLEAKLDGLQTPRGWGLFLIERMVDEVRTSDEDGRHTVELVVDLKEVAMATVELEADVRQDGDTAVIELAGDIDRSAEPVLDDAYRATGGAANVVLDFGRVSYINSTGIAVIVGLLARTRAEGRKLVARGLSPHYRQIFEITRLSDFMTIVDQEGDMTQTELDLGVRRPVETVAVLDIAGDVTAASEEPLMDAFHQADGSKAVILNFAGLAYMNSGGIGLLVTLLVRANRAKQRLLAVGLTDHYRQIFELTRLDEAIGIYATEADAVAAVA